MRKLLWVFLVALCFTFVTTGQSLNIGSKAGINFASLNGDNTQGFDGRTGFHFGAVVRVGITELFSLQPEVNYSEQGFTDTVSFMVDNATGKLNYLNVPVLLDFKVVSGLSLQGGPQVGFVLVDEIVDIPESPFPDTPFPSSIELNSESVVLAGVIGAQYELPLGLFFQVRYGIGLTDITDGTDAKNSNFSISAGYFFL